MESRNEYFERHFFVIKKLIEQGYSLNFISDYIKAAIERANKEYGKAKE